MEEIWKIKQNNSKQLDNIFFYVVLKLLKKQNLLNIEYLTAQF